MVSNQKWAKGAFLVEHVIFTIHFYRTIWNIEDGWQLLTFFFINHTLYFMDI